MRMARRAMRCVRLWNRHLLRSGAGATTVVWPRGIFVKKFSICPRRYNNFHFCVTASFLAPLSPANFLKQL